ncbi:unnamed protein product [Blepharisma stoltei]|uniref:Uncharacterized protein n=1 Tax=Blepharisma stoltei TaxID=1481888 RepID=A0AAU9IN86_9CILI|nr:unnamed protein product [Blepharisma stoltei]
MERDQHVSNIDSHILDIDESIGNWNSKEFQKPTPQIDLISELYEFKKSLNTSKQILCKHLNERIRILQDQITSSINEIDKLEKSVKKWIAAAKVDKQSKISISDVQKLSKISILAISNDTIEAFKEALEQLKPNIDYNTIDIFERYYDRILEELEIELEWNKKKQEMIEEKKDDYKVENKKSRKSQRDENEDSEVNEYDVLIVMRHTRASRFEATNALKLTGNFSDAIIYIAKGKIP